MNFHLRTCSRQERQMLAEAVELQPYFFDPAGKNLDLSWSETPGYAVTFDGDGCRVAYHTRPQLCRALLFLASLDAGTDCREQCSFSEFGVMVDVSRNAVLKPETVRQLIRMAAYMGYTFVGLYMEDTIQVKDEPYFGYMRGALTAQEIKETDAYANVFGIELRPFIQTLAHLNQITRYEEYQKIIDTDDILLAGDARTEELLRHLIATVADRFSSRKINIGMDEAHMLGLGKYLDVHGYTDRMQIMQTHLQTVLSICREYGFTVQMWSDMFFKLASHGAYYDSDEHALKDLKIPQDVEIAYWDYYATDEAHYDAMIRRHQKLSGHTAFVGGAWKWTGFIPHNRYSIEAGKAALAACKANGISSVTITCWGDDGAEASVFGVLPALFADAQMAYENKLDEKAFQIISGGYTFSEFLLLDDANPYLTDGTCHNNASKYLLYNDPLIGTFDSVLLEDTPQQFKHAAQCLKELPEQGAFSYIMETAAALCDVLAVKADLGKRIKQAYDTKNNARLQQIAQEDLPDLGRRLEDFYRSFYRQWNRENKSFGFEVQTVRIGGLMQRCKDVQQILLDYTKGQIPSIAELEEERKPFHYFEGQSIRELNYNLWTDIVSPSRV